MALLEVVQSSAHQKTKLASTAPGNDDWSIHWYIYCIFSSKCIGISTLLVHLAGTYLFLCPLNNLLDQ